MNDASAASQQGRIAVLDTLTKSKAPESRRLAGFLSGLTIDDVPSQGAVLLKACLLDTIGCALGGRKTRVSMIVDGMAREIGGGGRCTIIGSPSRVSPEMAAMANGVSAHALVFDDLHRHAKLHPGVCVVPAVWAMADLLALSGKAFLSAMAAGYEATARVGVAIGMASHRAKGWRATGTAGSFGAAAGAARAAGLDAESFHHALAASGAQAAGNWAFQESAGMELYLAAGVAARNGVVAAMLARAGFQGAADPLTAADGGYFRSTSDEADPLQLSEGLGMHYRLLDTCIKMYPTCHSSQTGIDAAMNLRERHAIRPEDVDRIVVRAGEITRLQCGWTFEPAPPPKLIFHMGYAMALALRYGAVRPSDFEGETPHDPELARVALATEVVPDAELTAIYAEKKPSDVTVYLKDGRALRERVDYCRGEPENPPTPDTLLRKFRIVAGDGLDAATMDEIAERVLNLESEASLARLGELVAQ
jgi:2-methylcitrate dehydratase PrpD